MKFIDQTIAFPPCPQRKRPAAPKSPSGETNFLFVNSKEGQIPEQSRQPMRSHVMQHARSQRKWSTSKGVVNWTAETESSRSSSEEDDRLQALPESSELSLIYFQKRPRTKRRATEGMIYRNQTQMLLNQSGCHDPQCTGPPNCADSCAGCKIQRTSDVLPINVDWALDPYRALPVRLDPASRWMLDQCKLAIHLLCSFRNSPKLSCGPSMNPLGGEYHRKPSYCTVRCSRPLVAFYSSI